MIRVDAMDLVQSLRQLAPELEAAARRILTETASFAADAARTSPSFKDRTGALRSSIRRTVRGNFHETVSAGVSGRSNVYAMFVETGTPPHIIRAKGRENGGSNWLRFYQDGVLRFAKEVRHPGTPGDRATHYKRHFLADSQREAEQQIPVFVQSNLSRLFR